MNAKGSWLRFTGIVILCLSSATAVNAASGVWSNPLGGNWSDVGNWVSGNVADGADYTADFSTLDLTSDEIVNLNGDRTIGNLIFGDATPSNSWTLNAGTGGTLTLSTAAGTPTITVNNQTTTINAVLTGTQGMTKNGTGTLVMGSNTLQFTGLFNTDGSLNTPAVTTVNAGILRVNNQGFSANSYLNIAAGAVVESDGTLNVNVATGTNGGTSSNNIRGAGTLRLISTTNNDTHPDIYFGPDHSANSYYGGRITANIDLGSSQRYIFGKTGHNSVSNYIGDEDARINGSISGSGGITFIGQNTYSGMNPNLVLGGANTFTGTVEIRMGSIYLMNPQALAQGNKLLFSTTDATSNARLFLYGSGATVSNLESTGPGGAMVANGNVVNPAAVPAATLTVNQTADTVYSGLLVNTQAEYDRGSGAAAGPLSLVINGTKSLTLTGANTYSGTTTVNGGTLIITNSHTSAGDYTINAGGAVIIGNASSIDAANFTVGGTLGGTGSLPGSVLLNSSGVIAPGIVSPGTLTLGNLTTSGGGTLKFNLDTATYGTNDLISVTSGILTLGHAAGKTTININQYNGSLASDSVYPLISYGSYMGGSVADEFTLAGISSGGTSRQSFSLINDAALSQIELKVTGSTADLTWTASVNNKWDLATSKNWSNAGTADKFFIGDKVTFDDSSANANVTVDAVMQPGAVTFNNYTKNYVLSGAGKITGTGGLTKNGSATLTINLNGNNYTGATTIYDGTIAQGVANALPINTLLDTGSSTTSVFNLNNFAAQIGGLTGWGTVKNTGGTTKILTVGNASDSTFSGSILDKISLVKSGSGKLTLAGENSYTGDTTINSGTLEIGNGNMSGSIVSGPITDNGIFQFNRSDDVSFMGTISGTGGVTQNGYGKLTLSPMNSYTGVTTIANGVLTTDSLPNGGVNSFMGASTNAASNLVFTGGTLQYTGLSATSDRSFTVLSTGSGAGGTIEVTNASTVLTLSGVATGNGTFSKTGDGTLVFSANNALQAAETMVNGGTLRFVNASLARNNVLNINSGAFAESDGTLTFLVSQNASSDSNPVQGGGTLKLISTTNSPTSPDIYFGPDHSGNSYWGVKVSANIDLGSVQRYIYGKTGHNSVSVYPGNEDARIDGAISGSGGITFIAQNTYGGSSPMEANLVLAGANTFTGPMEIRRGSIYLQNAQALAQNNKLLFNTVDATHNARLFLYGNGVSVSNLESTGPGSALIANGNAGNPSDIAAATLTTTQTADTIFGGILVDAQAEYDRGSGYPSGPLSLEIKGTNKLTLTGTNTYSGTTTVGAGAALQVGNGGTTGSLGDNGISPSSVTVDGSLIFNRSNAVAFGGLIGGAGSLTKNNSNTLTLNGPLSYTGPTTINGGTLVVNGGHAAGGDYIVNSGGTLTGSNSSPIDAPVVLNAGGRIIPDVTQNNITFRSLTTSGGGSLNLGLSNTANSAGGFTNDKITLTGDLTLGHINGLTNVNLTLRDNVLGTGTYDLIAFGGNYSGSAPSNELQLVGVDSTTRQRYNLVKTTGLIQLQVTGSPSANLIWQGLASTANWDWNSTRNWNNSGTTDVFYNKDNVAFDNSSTHGNVNLVGTLIPLSVTVANDSAHNYIFSGTGKISGATGLNKSGAGTLTISNSGGNDFTGPVTVSEGKLALGSANALPTTAALTVSNPGMLDLAGYNAQFATLSGDGTVNNSAGSTSTLTVGDATNFTFAGAFQGNAGLIKIGSGSLTLTGTSTSASPVTISAGILSIGDGTTTGSVAAGIIDNASLQFNPGSDISYASPISGSGNLLVVGTHKITLSGASSYTGVTTINAATLSTNLLANGGVNSGIGAAAANIAANLVLTAGGTLQYTGATVSTDRGLTLGTGGGIIEVPTSGTTLTFSGDVSGQNPFTKTGDGTLVFTQPINSATASQSITVNGGILQLASQTFNGNSSRILSIGTGTTVKSTGTIQLAVGAANPSIDVTGAGTLRLASTANSATSPDIYFGYNHSGTNYWGARIESALDLGSQQRFIWGKSGHNGVGQYTLQGTDCQFAGSISGSGGMTLIGQNTWSNMEVPFALNAANTFTGPVEIQRGSLYLGNADALDKGNVLTFNPAAGNNARFFLYGNNAVISDLSSIGAGSSVISNGNKKTGAKLTLGDALLTITQNHAGVYNGLVTDAFSEYDGSGSGTTGSLGIVKDGPAALTLSGTLSYTGNTLVKQGTLTVTSLTTSPNVTVLGTLNAGSLSCDTLTIGGSGAAVAVPEPCMWSLLALALLAFASKAWLMRK